MKKILVMIGVLFLNACDNFKHEKVEITAESEAQFQGKTDTANNEVNQSKIADNDQDLSTITSEKNNASIKENTPKIICLDKDLSEWYTFDESKENAECTKLRNYSLGDYKCSVEKNVFGLESDGIRITLQDDNRVIAFDSITQCNEAIEMAEANGY